jgi:MinD-like ATPase involved in chromosome partitioning or flagellar assembly
VGKSAVVANLAVTFAQGGRQVVVVDLDPIAPRQHQLLGVADLDSSSVVPGAALSALLTPGGATALVATKAPGVRLLLGQGAARVGLAAGESLRALAALQALPGDVLIIDVGAGSEAGLLDVLHLGAHRLIVTTPQVASMHESFGLLRAAMGRLLRGQLGAAAARLLEPPAALPDGEKAVDLDTRIRNIDPILAARIRDIQASFGACVVGNLVQEPGQVGIFHALGRMMNEYLGLEAPILGWLPSSAKMAEACRDGSPSGLRPSQAQSDEARALRTIAEVLLDAPIAPVEAWLQAAIPEPVVTPSDPATSLVSGRVGPPPLPRTSPERTTVPIRMVSTKPPPPQSVATPVKTRVYKRPSHKRAANDNPEATAIPVGRRRVALPGMPPGRSGG